MKKYIILVLIISNLYSIVFDRRDDIKTYNSYFAYPFVVNMPGLGSSAGAGVLANNIFNSDTDFLYLHSEGDFKIDIFSIIDIPIYQKDSINITISPFYLDFQDGTVEAFQRGRDSSLDDKYYLDTKQFKIQGAEISFQYLDNQIELYTGLFDIYANPKSIRDQWGNELADNIDDLDANMYRYGLYIDDTDSRRDPRIGYRVQYERMGVIHQEKKFGDGYQDDISLSAFIPIVNHNNVLVLNYFHSAATITREGEVNPDDYICTQDDDGCVQSIYDEIRKRREDEVKRGNATSLGGVNRLRAYPQGRFYDTYTAFFGAEYRWYIKNYWKPFDSYLWRGVNTGWQLAVFQEFGQVSDKNNHTLYEDMKSSTGIGVRVLFNTMVVRLDIATGEEGEQVSFFYGYSF
jgi:hypothetical protein